MSSSSPSNPNRTHDLATPSSPDVNIITILSKTKGLEARGTILDPFVEIPSGESKVHIEVLLVLWGNRLPIPDGSLPLSRRSTWHASDITSGYASDPEVSYWLKGCGANLRAKKDRLELIINQGWRLKLKDAPLLLDPSLICYK
ncbi:hypothetical protein Tco_0750948 [Tanacetum coccineum]|uniref:Uncharacterized protein n=1 Tax=Tanacetum coccineum TaxID=301880 RepID=A0ABQ4Z3H7_9ASTR